MHSAMDREVFVPYAVFLHKWDKTGCWMLQIRPTTRPVGVHESIRRSEMRNAILHTICGVALGAGLTACSELPQVRVLHDPLTPEEHVTLGLTYEVQRHRDLAAREYRTALAQQAGYIPALIGLGNLAFTEGELEESEAFYRQALEASPEHPVANNNLAMLYLARGGDLREAERLALRALVHKGPLQPYVLDTLANVYARQGRFEEAVRALEEA